MSMPSPLRPALLASALLLATASVAASEPQQARTIIVMDGSGSMWGQIDGRPKLEIARETVADVVGKLPANQTLGLIAYGVQTDTTTVPLWVKVACAVAIAAGTYMGGWRIISFWWRFFAAIWVAARRHRTMRPRRLGCRWNRCSLHWRACARWGSAG